MFESESKKEDPHHILLNEIQRGVKLKKAPEIRDRSKPNLRGALLGFSSLLIIILAELNAASAKRKLLIRENDHSTTPKEVQGVKPPG